MPSCSVSGCTTYNQKTKGLDIHYHVFPRDQQIQKVWISKCKRKDKFNVSTGRVCSQHFTENDYVRDLKSELLGLPSKKVLKNDAVPTVNIPSSCTIYSKDLQHSSVAKVSDVVTPYAVDKANRCHARGVRKRLLETLDNLSPKKCKVDQCTTTDQILLCTSSKEKQMLNYIKSLETRNQRLNTSCMKLKAQNKCLISEVRSVKQQLHECMKNCDSKVAAEVSRVLGKLFTENQIQCLLKGKKCIKWDKNDICKAITLRAVSRKCYIFLRTKMGFPLPGISTLKRWINSSFHCRPGILCDVIQLMKTQGMRLSSLERLSVISFDEMNVDSRISYDQEEDKIVGPHSNVQVAMVRGLLADWKQPIFFDFDVGMTGALLNDIISSLEDATYNVVAVVSDLGGKNRTVWNQLGVTHTNTCFPNPRNPQKRVWVFADVPHLLKLLRNHFLDDGLTLPGSKKVSKTIIEQLLAMDSGEMKICHKLSLHHLAVKGRDRQRVYLAAQLFSNHTAQAVRFLMPHEEDTAKFFQLINDSFDILNSRNPNDIKKLARGFGTLQEVQERILRQLYACMQGMRVGKSLKHLPFQKGFFTTIRSMLGLFNDLKALNVKYILTAKLNQDCLEIFFSQIRGIGHFHDHPLPAEVKFRIRLLILGTNVLDIPMSSSSPVIRSDDNCTYLTSQLFGNILPDMTEPLAMIEGDEEIRSITFDCSTLDELSPVPLETDCPAEGFRYLAGYIAYRGRQHDKSLGTPTGQLLTVNPNVAPIGWIEVLSRGGLLVPSDEWMNKISQFELMFVAFHGRDSLSHESNVMNKLFVQIHQRFPEVHTEVVKIYVRTRTFIRLRHLNANARTRKAKAAQLRKARKWQASTK